MSIRQPAVAGAFYPAGKKALENTVRCLLGEAQNRSLCPKVLVVPHAGYIYSGAVAASAYKLLQPRRGNISRVVLLGPSHCTPFRGLALPDSDVFNTPLGPLSIDHDAATQLLTFSQVCTLEAAHELEHSLEVQLPFLQTCLDDFQLIPLVVGETPPQAVAEILEFLWGGQETLIVISTDLSHFHSYTDAQQHDAATVAAIEQLHTNLNGEQACGCRPLNGLLALAQQKHMSVTTLDVCNSGDTAGDRSRVVGYGAFALQ